MCYTGGVKDVKYDIPVLENTQIHKYKELERPNKYDIFEKQGVPGYQI